MWLGRGGWCLGCRGVVRTAVVVVVGSLGRADSLGRWRRGNSAAVLAPEGKIPWT